MAKPSKRSYDQYCSLAVALDVVGERWTLLIVRELLIRPRRYGELLQALPGISTNLLAERLEYLLTTGIIRAADGQSRRSGYVLTGHGEALRQPVLALARWGMEMIASQADAGQVNPDWAMLGVQALIDDERASSGSEDYLFNIDGEVFTISVKNGHAQVIIGPVETPAMTVVTDAATLMEIGSRQLDPIIALAANRVTVTGDPEAMRRCLNLLGLYGDSSHTVDTHTGMPAVEPARP